MRLVFIQHLASKPHRSLWGVGLGCCAVQPGSRGCASHIPEPSIQACRSLVLHLTQPNVLGCSARPVGPLGCLLRAASSLQFQPAVGGVARVHRSRQPEECQFQHDAHSLLLSFPAHVQPAPLAGKYLNPLPRWPRVPMAQAAGKGGLLGRGRQWAG